MTDNIKTQLDRELVDTIKVGVPFDRSGYHAGPFHLPDDAMQCQSAAKGVEIRRYGLKKGRCNGRQVS